VKNIPKILAFILLDDHLSNSLFKFNALWDRTFFDGLGILKPQYMGFCFVYNSACNNGTPTEVTKSILMHSTMWGHLDILKTLLGTKLNTKKGDCRRNLHLQFDINKKDNKGNTPLQIGAELGYFNIVKLLIERGAKVNTTDNSGKTPLHKAAAICNTNIVEHLIDNGAATNIQDNKMWTVLQVAVLMEQLEVVKCLIEKKN
jgi:ankyrin repeat protein